MELEAILWLAVMVVLIIFEIATMGLYTIWFAGGCLIAFFAALLGFGVLTQVGVCLVVSGLLLVFTRPVVQARINKDMVKTNSESLVGLTARVIEGIDNAEGMGRAVVGGQEWMARALNEEDKFAVDSLVEIVNISGVKLIVKRVED